MLWNSKGLPTQRRLKAGIHRALLRDNPQYPQAVFVFSGTTKLKACFGNLAFPTLLSLLKQTNIHSIENTVIESHGLTAPEV